MMVEKMLAMLGIDADSFRKQAEMFRAEATAVINHFNTKLVEIQTAQRETQATMALLQAQLAALQKPAHVVIDGDDTGPALPLLLNGVNHNGQH